MVAPGQERDLKLTVHPSRKGPNVIFNGINEHYDSVSGKPLGVKDYCMSCTLVTMMLDGLTQEYKLRLRDEPREVELLNKLLAPGE